MTKREDFVAISEALTVAGAPAELVEVITKEIALIDKRKAAPRKETAAQLANAGIKVAIVEVIGGAEDGMTATMVADAVGVSVQKATQLLKQLVDAGEVIRTEGKGKVKTLFTV